MQRVSLTYVVLLTAIAVSLGVVDVEGLAGQSRGFLRKISYDSYHVTNGVEVVENNYDMPLTKFVVILPLAQTNNYQIVSNVDASGAEILDIPETDDKYVRYTVTDPNELPPQEIPPATWTWDYGFDVTLFRIEADLSQITEIYDYNTSSDIYTWYTGNSGVIVDPANEQIIEWGDELWDQSDEHYLAYARLCYELMEDLFTYPVVPPDDGLLPLSEVIEAREGDCGNLCSVYISLLRYKGIPSRHIVTVRPNATYHVWADFYLEDYGWIPVDVSAKVQPPHNDYFGICVGDGIVFTKEVWLLLEKEDGNPFRCTLLQTHSWWPWPEEAEDHMRVEHRLSATDWEVSGTCPPDFEWLEWSTVSSPSARIGHAMAYDPNCGVLVLFGGHNNLAGFLDDTYHLVHNTWNDISDISVKKPLPRCGHAMAPFGILGILIFGGRDDGGKFDDTWLLSGCQWNHITVPGPGPRSDHAMVYDRNRTAVILYGGAHGAVYDDTWTFDGTGWSPMTASGPGPRVRHAMVYDAGRDVTVLFGGSSPDYPEDTWELDGNTWVQVATTGPAGRAMHSMIYDQDRGVTVLYGGFNASGNLDDTWEWDGVSWEEVTGSSPGARAHHCMAYNPAPWARRGVLFGGTQYGVGPDLNDTWFYPGWSYLLDLEVHGSSNNVGWSQSVSDLSSSFEVHDYRAGPAPGNAQASVLADSIVESINYPGCGGLMATTKGNVFTIVAASTHPLLFSVGVDGQVPHCELPTVDLCTFNPDLSALELLGEDCNGNLYDDAIDLANGTSLDENENSIPDECEVPGASGAPVIQIEKTHKTYQGQHEYVSVTWASGIFDMGGFDFLIAYDASALTFMEATPGQLLEDCGWEYFTYRYGAQGNCGDACPSGLLRIVAIAETNNGSNHPTCYGAPDADPHELARMDFLVTNDRTFECMYVPIRFFWIDCGDNSVSSVDGDLLFVSDHVYEFDGTDITDPTYGFATYFGVQQECLENSDPDKPTPIQLIDFVNGGIDIICAESIDVRGDINLNEIGYEVADAVLFANYFVYGPSVFTINLHGQIAASDVNADGLTLSVADLVYLIRVVIGDAPPYPKAVTPVEAGHMHVAGVLAVDSDIPMGAALVVAKGDVTPELLAADMELRYNFDGTNTRILVYSLEGNGFTGEFLKLDADIVSVEMATAEGNPVVATLLPNEFALHQNYPNPFNGITTITFDLKERADYTLTIYNVNGQEVEVFTGTAEPGMKTITWDAARYATGVYMYRLEAGRFTDTKKMVLLK